VNCDLEESMTEADIEVIHLSCSEGLRQAKTAIRLMNLEARSTPFIDGYFGCSFGGGDPAEIR